jgi:4'-phosphopantetheinyl transferase
VSWRDTPADWHRDGISLWLLPHAPRQRGEPTARAHLSRALGMPPSALPITRDAQGRPHFIAPLHRLETGWSHSGERLLLALGEDIELGVDIERLRPRPRAMELAHRFYHPHETAWLRSLDDEEARTLAFLRLWCVKEAVLKAHGQGISFGLHRFHVRLEDDGTRLAACDPSLGRADDWHLHEWSAAPGYRAALAWHPRGAAWRPAIMAR